MIAEAFGICATEFHEDHNIGYDYIVEQLVRMQLKFTMPDNFDIGEFDMKECLKGASERYRVWMKEELTRVGRRELLK